MNTNNDNQPSDSAEASNAAGGDCVSRTPDMIEHTNSPLLCFCRWMRCRVLRYSYWEIGTLGVLEARRSKINGRVEIFAPRSNPEHSLWLETHKDHWEKFKKNAQSPPTGGKEACKPRTTLSPVRCDDLFSLF